MFYLIETNRVKVFENHYLPFEVSRQMQLCIVRTNIWPFKKFRNTIQSYSLNCKKESTQIIAVLRLTANFIQKPTNVGRIALERQAR